MNKKLNDSAAIRVQPPIFFFICLGFGLLLEFLFPTDIFTFLLIPRVIIGGIFIIIAWLFAVGGFVTLIKNKTTFNTAKSTIKIVTSGSFKFSRNPLYLSLLLLLFGIAVLMSSLWLFLTIPVLYILFLFKAVKPEEAYLAQKFGKEYLEYCAKVRRWL